MLHQNGDYRSGQQNVNKRIGELSSQKQIPGRRLAFGNLIVAEAGETLACFA